MKAIILAAGQGTRLRPLTDAKPKCLVEYRGRALLDYSLEALRANGIDSLAVVTGYRADAIQRAGVQQFHNPRFAESNMVESFFCAESFFDQDLIVVYGDIIFGPSVIRALLADPHEISVVIDRDWLALWNLRMEDPLRDAETMRLAPDGRILELGKKPKSLAEIEGQYIGLFRIRARALNRVREFYQSLDRDALYDGKSFRQMYMTSFIQLLIDRLMPVYAVPIHGGWLEIDEPKDLEVPVVLG